MPEQRIYKLMRIVTWLLLGTLPTWGQNVLTITDAQKANPIAPYVYFLKDATHTLTAEQVARYPLDSFQALNQKEIVGFGYFTEKIWLRFEVKNKTSEDLYLIHSFRGFHRIEVIIRDEKEQQRAFQAGLETPALHQQVLTRPPIFPIGSCPKVIYLTIVSGNAYGDYIHIGNLEHALSYQKNNTIWQSFSLGIFVLVFIYAFIFSIRLRDSLIGWYALLMFSIITFYLDFYAFLPVSKYLISPSFIYQLCWSLFHVKFLNLRFYSKTLYWAIMGLNGLYFMNWIVTKMIRLVDNNFPSLLYRLLFWLKIDWGGYILIVLFMLLIGLVYVSIKNFKQVWVYGVAFSISLIAMIISMFALYNISWLPFIPYNNSFVPGTLIEIIMLGYILAQRTGQHRKEQFQTQQQLIVQLQENLRQQNKLLQIRDEIARDLHDEVGATLTSIATSAKVIQKKNGNNNPETNAILGQIKADSEEAIHTIRDTVWALNPNNDTPEKLLEKMRAVGFKLLTTHDISFVFENEVPATQLPVFIMEQRRNLYLVYKEALHNIAKHAHATTVQVRIYQQANVLHIQILDDGQGFDCSKNTDGNGLKNFQKRAKEGGFEVNVSSGEGIGTIIEMIVNNIKK
ncbi:sensor histidine kinase [Runella salmonicolor]|uniref:Histidine kinase n=1 Tax=Runella salmonicolor TaxID=2950278 RepID=A0ABT1FM17_9BACT|nr:histidine kinase [Runella salmonicolor]MCP1382810.1 histidine kinase [Runella salmonicolor]